MFRRLKQRKFALPVAALVAVLVAGGAYAYWTTNGSGTGSAGTGSDSGVTVAQVGTISGLVPGGNAQAVDFKINNPISTKQYIHSVQVSIASVTKAASATGSCDAGDFTVVQPNAINSDLVPGDTSFSPSGATIAMKDLATNQDGCKGATVNLAFQAS
jgi:hypothetical protein